MAPVKRLLNKLSKHVGEKQNKSVKTLDDFLHYASKEPQLVFRNIFQLYNDFIYAYIGEGVEEYPEDSESIGFVDYDCKKLFVEGTDHSFFADRLFANDLMDDVGSLKRAAQQNKIYIYEGPPGSGKSTFLNNLLLKLEEYTKLPEGAFYETIWKIDKKRLKEFGEDYITDMQKQSFGLKNGKPKSKSVFLDIPCPSHDHPILMIPKSYRKDFLKDLIKDEEFKEKLFTKKEYEWVFKWKPCTICTSLYKALLDKLDSPEEVFKMIHARNYQFNRSLGEGISIFNAGDKIPNSNVISNKAIQDQLSEIFGDSKKVEYLFSRYAKTNNGLYALMDIKGYNKTRLHNLHGIISEGVHKVEDIEENVHSLFLAVMNPEDRVDINGKEGMKAFVDRLDYKRLPYVMDYNTEVKIYEEWFGDIEKYFLPNVLKNFAKVVISTRLNQISLALGEWIPDSKEYTNYCDRDLLLLKMDIYTGYIPTWLSEEDRKNFVACIRRKVIDDAKHEGFEGISGRDSIKLFNNLYSDYIDIVEDGSREKKLIDMAILKEFFEKDDNKLVRDKDNGQMIPDEFLDSLINSYDYNLLQEIKASLYSYSEKEISKDVHHYIYASNFDINDEEDKKIKCRYTGKTLEVSEEFFETLELRILGIDVSDAQRKEFRQFTQKEYVTKVLMQKKTDDLDDLTGTALYKELFDMCVFNLKENVLDPLIANPNFRNAIRDFKTEDFRTYDSIIKKDVGYLITNLKKNHGYTTESAKQVCLYAIDNEITKKFSK